MPKLAARGSTEESWREVLLAYANKASKKVSRSEHSSRTAQMPSGCHTAYAYREPAKHR
jgi:hypothetical protein